MTPRRAVALAIGLALVAGGSVAVDRWRGSDGTRDVLSPASSAVPTRLPSAELPTTPVTGAAFPTSTPAASELLSGWVRLAVPRVRLEPTCPTLRSTPPPVHLAVVAEKGDDAAGVQTNGTRAWLTFARDLRTRAVLLELASGKQASFDLDGSLPEAVGLQGVFGISRGPSSPGLSELSTTEARVVRTWGPSQLAGLSADHVAVSGGRVLVLHYDEAGTHLAALDERSGGLLWQRLLEPFEPAAFGPGADHELTADAGEAIVVTRVPGSVLRHVYRLDRDGVVRARAQVVGPALNMDPVVVADGQGVFLGLRDELPGANNGFTHLFRLDRRTLRPRGRALLPGYVDLAEDHGRVMTSTVACDAFVVTRLDPSTLKTSVAYDVDPGNTEAHQFAFADGRMVVVHKKRFQDRQVVVSTYDLS